MKPLIQHRTHDKGEIRNGRAGKTGLVRSEREGMGKISTCEVRIHQFRKRSTWHERRSVSSDLVGNLLPTLEESGTVRG